MADFAPPSGPPPPKVPEGWKAVWNEQYKEWFFVNTFTKKSQWDKPTEPIYGPDSDHAGSSDAPPSYDNTKAQATGPEKGGLGGNNPFRSGNHDMSEDERLARQLQEEENHRAGVGSSTTDRGEADSYYNSASGPGTGAGAYSQPGVAAGAGAATATAAHDDGGDTKSRGLFGKLLGKKQNPPQQQYRPPQGQYYPQQGGYGGAPGYGPGPGYPPPGGYYPPQGYPPQQAYGGRPGGGGMGVGGAAALGVGGGLLGGVLLGEALEGGHDGGGDDGGYGGGDGGGGDYGGGGDFGGGGGDF